MSDAICDLKQGFPNWESRNDVQDRREYINFTQSTAYTIVSVVIAHTILHIL